MDRLLSNTDLERALGGNCLVINYQRLYDLPPDIMRILDIAHGKLIVLYEESPHRGHWVSVVRGEGPQAGRIFYTDPYGDPVDDPLRDYSAEWARESRQDICYLAHLLGAAPDPIEIWRNEWPLQSSSSEVATCGRWALARAMMPFLSEDQFASLWLPGPGEKFTPDQVVTAWTNRLLR
jgi:hypothetical protein